MAHSTNRKTRAASGPAQTVAGQAVPPLGRPDGEHPLVGGVTADGCPIAERAIAGAVDEGEPAPPAWPAPQRAPALPTTDLGGASTSAVLKRYATDAVAVMFDCINQLREDATAARAIPTPQGLAVAAMATKSAGSLAKDVITFTVGHKLDVHVSIKSQEDVPRWDSLPVAVRAKFEQAIGEATDSAWEAPTNE